MVQSLYNFGIYAMQGFVSVAGMFGSKMKKRSQGTALAFETLAAKVDKNAKYTWFHVASLGEFEQARPMIERLRQAKPDAKILLTFFSPSGYDVRCNYNQADIITYMPFDTPKNVRRFFELVNIEKAVFVKYEFWANFLHELKSREIPTYIISAIFRPTQLFFKSYGKFFADMLRCYTTLYVQDELSRELLASINVNNVVVGDDTRFDRVADIAKAAKKLPIPEAFVQDKLILVAGSSWQPDEEYLLRYINKHKERVKLIIAPHEVHQARIDEICAKLRCHYVLYTETNEAEAAKANCLIINTIGILSSLYQYGQVAYIGGGFGVGIHNTLEAAVWRMPVVFGPNYMHFREARDLIACGGGYSVRSYRQFEDLVDRLFEDKEAANQAGDYVQKHIGATDLIFGQIFA